MPRLTLEALAAVETIERCGSFAAAAAELHRATSTLSHTVQVLETRLGTALFDRSGHRATLTPAGRAMLEDGRDLLAAAHTLERRVQSVGSGWERELVIAVDDLLPVDWLLPVLTKFFALGQPTRVTLRQEVLGGVWETLQSQRADLALLELPAVPCGELTHRLAASVPFVFTVAPTHPLATEKQPLTLTQVRRHRVVVVADSARTAPLHERGVSGLGTPPDVLRVTSFQAKRAAQIAGVGVGFLPLPWAREALASGELVALDVAFPKPSATLQVAWHTRSTGAALSWFVEHLQMLTATAPVTQVCTRRREASRRKRPRV